MVVEVVVTMVVLSVVLSGAGVVVVTRSKQAGMLSRSSAPGAGGQAVSATPAHGDAVVVPGAAVLGAPLSHQCALWVRHIGITYHIDVSV